MGATACQTMCLLKRKLNSSLCSIILLRTIHPSNTGKCVLDYGLSLGVNRMGCNKLIHRTDQETSGVLLTLNPFAEERAICYLSHMGIFAVLPVKGGVIREQPCSLCHSCETHAAADFKGEFLTADGSLCLPRPEFGAEPPGQSQNQSWLFPSAFTTR